MNMPGNLRDEEQQQTWLEQRVDRLHLRQRLGIENDHESQIIGRGRNFFHIENWYSLHGLIRGILKLSLMYRRGRNNTLAIETRHNSFQVEHLPQAFKDYTILHISDLHLDMLAEFPAVLAQQIRGLEYDICVLTGDFRGSTHGDIEPTLSALQYLRPHFNKPVYAILGNHDSIHMVPVLEDMDVRVLLNESVELERDGSVIYMAGIDDPHYFRADNLQKASVDIPLDGVSILLSHSPEIYRHAAHAGFDIMLCGHTHGGQICLPGGYPVMCNVRAPRKVCRGAWRYQNMQAYTSAGSGASVVEARFNCPPEITLHRLQRSR